MQDEPREQDNFPSAGLQDYLNTRFDITDYNTQFDENNNTKNVRQQINRKERDHNQFSQTEERKHDQNRKGHRIGNIPEISSIREID